MVRTVRAFTMMELLVTLGILAIALASVLSIFARGSQFGLKAQERTEGSRVAQAVFDLVDRGFLDSGANPIGRDEYGNILNEPAGIFSHDLKDARELDGVMGFSAYEPAYVIRSHLDLVWRCTIVDHAVDGVTGMHLLTITVRFDDNGNGRYDEDPNPANHTDRLESRHYSIYYAILADREVSP